MRAPPSQMRRRPTPPVECQGERAEIGHMAPSLAQCLRAIGANEGFLLKEVGARRFQRDVCCTEICERARLMQR
jgi:hypothetical protein